MNDDGRVKMDPWILLAYEVYIQKQHGNVTVWAISPDTLSIGDYAVYNITTKRIHITRPDDLPDLPDRLATFSVPTEVTALRSELAAYELQLDKLDYGHYRLVFDGKPAPVTFYFEDALLRFDSGDGIPTGRWAGVLLARIRAWLDIRVAYRLLSEMQRWLPETLQTSENWSTDVMLSQTALLQTARVLTPGGEAMPHLATHFEGIDHQVLSALRDEPDPFD